MPHDPRLKELLTIDITDLSQQRRTALRAAIDKELAPGASPTAEFGGDGGWTKEGLRTYLARLAVGRGHVQAKAMERALDNGGEVSREEIFELGAYEPDRSLKGFTKPFKRILKQMKAAGELPDDAIEPFWPAYDPRIRGYQQAPRFQVPEALLGLWTDN